MPDRLATELHPQARQVIDAMAAAGVRAIESLTPEDARAQQERLAAARNADAPPVARIEQRVTDTGIPLRLYWPTAARPPVVVYLHGGGHVIGSLDTHDKLARQICLGAEALVVSVQYRKAPEHRFPAAVEDADAALSWVQQHAAALGADARRIAVAGDSAGANLATVAALAARDRGAASLRMQLLIYPVTDYRCVSESYELFASGYGVLGAATMRYFQTHYLRGTADALDWRASPLLAASAEGLPPTTIIIAGCDPLRDDGRSYGARLRAAGVPVTVLEYPGMIHGFFNMTGLLDDAMTAQNAAFAALREAFA